jgi:hypothetical protein
MKKFERLLGVLFAHFALTRGFSISSASVWENRASPLFAKPQASVVSVCTAELCCCQDEGLGGDEILAELQSRNLPYAVDEAICLGACGGGAMVAIDFEDGSSALVTGLQETLMELGLPDSQMSERAIFPTEPVSSESTVDRPIASTNNMKMEELELSSNERDAGLSSQPAAITIGFSDPSKLKKPQRTKKSSTAEFVDVRDRMRAAASKEDEERVNPWFNAASYLAGKAAKQLFGDR